MQLRQLLLLAGLAVASTVHAGGEQFSGSWYDPARAGEGFVVQVFDDARALVTWFTYPPPGSEAVQAWMIGNGTFDGTTIEISNFLITSGGKFGPGFDPDDVIRDPWGNLTIEFSDCTHASARYSGPAEWGSGTLALRRLSEPAGLECQAPAVASSQRIVSGRSGAFLDLSHNGEGWMVELLGDSRVVLYWFTYDGTGQQRWLIGVGAMSGDNIWIETMLIASGAHFGDAFDPAEVVLENWGSLGVVYQGCHDGALRYASNRAEYGQGLLDYDRLISLEGTSCEAPEPAVPLTGGSWRNESGIVGLATSESASVAIGDWHYLAGGFGAWSIFRRYNSVTGEWQNLPDLPDGRHHPMMASDGVDVYLFGGYTGFNFRSKDNLWRYSPDTGQWTVLADMPFTKGAGAAVFLHGKFYVLGGDLAWLGEYDPIEGTWRLLPDAPSGSGDHTQAVVFEGEIWKLAGRSGGFTDNRVDIWNPVTESWRSGPAMQFQRSGFAAEVVQGQIVVTAGEVFSNSVFVERSTEVFAPGASGWTLAPVIPAAVHGVMGSTAAGELVVLGGSTIAGATSGATRRVQIYTPAPESN